MLSYFVVLLLMAIFTIADRYSRNNAWKIMMFVVFAFFSGFRFYVGTDYENYLTLFNDLDGEGSRELGVVHLVLFLKKIGGTAQLYIFIMATITQYFIYKTLIRYKKWFWISTYVYYTVSLFYFASFNMSRQYVAMSISFWALQYVEKNNFVKYGLSIVLAAIFFHITVIIFLPLYFYLKRIHSMWLYFSLIFVSVFFSGSISFIASVTSFNFYNLAESEANPKGTQYVFALVSLSMLVFGYKFRNFKNSTVIYNMNSLCLYSLIIVVLQSGMLMLMSQRISNYFILSYLLVIPSVLSSMNRKNAHVLRVGIIFFCFVYFIRTIVFIGSDYSLVPFRVNVNLFNF